MRNFLVRALIFGGSLLLPSLVLAAGPANFKVPAEYLEKQIFAARDEEKAVCNGVNCAPLSSCDCWVYYSKKIDSFGTNVNPYESNDPKERGVEQIRFYANKKNEQIASQLNHLGSTAWELLANVDLNSGLCALTVNTVDLASYEVRSSLNPMRGILDVGSCTTVTRKQCCCNKEEGEFSTRYFDCLEVSLTAATANTTCQGVLPVGEGVNRCEAEVIVKKKDAPKDGTSDVTIDLNTLREKAKALDVVKASPQALIRRAINLMMAFMGTILFALYVYAGFTWMLANGNDEKITMARNILVWSTLGVAVMMGSYVIIQFIFNTLAA